MRYTVLDVRTHDEPPEHLRHPADVVGVVVGGDHQIDRVDSGRGQLVGDEVGRGTRVDEDVAAARRRDERSVALADIELTKPECVLLPRLGARSRLSTGASDRRAPNEKRRGNCRGDP